jgi:hypothetical protein
MSQSSIDVNERGDLTVDRVMNASEAVKNE